MDELDKKTYLVEAVDLTHDAFGVCKLEDGYTVFVEDLLKGEKADIIVTERKANYGFGRVVNLIQRSPYRVAPKCAHYYECGGCALMHMDYGLQLAFKKYRVETTLKRQGLGNVPVADIVEMVVPYNYRNKVEIKFQQGEKGIEAGFFQAKTHRLVNLQECHIMSKRMFDLIVLIKNVFHELKLQAFDPVSQTGILKSAVIRETYRSKQMNVLFQLTQPLKEFAPQVVKKLTAKMPELVGIAQTVSLDPSMLSSDPVEILHGEGTIVDTIGTLQFLIGYRSFFQINPIQTEKLYEKALEYAALTGKERIIDAYCGVGTIGLYAAKLSQKVFGIEIVKTAIQDARKNAELNGIKNAFFEVGEAHVVIAKWKTYKFDVIFVDPPRKGCDKALLDRIIDMKIPKVVYVSCDQATLARDLRILVDGGYEVQEVTPFDMFPQTASVESVSLLTRKQS